MSSKGSAKRAEAVSSRNTQEDRARKKSATDSINSLFGVRTERGEMPVGIDAQTPEGQNKSDRIEKEIIASGNSPFIGRQYTRSRDKKIAAKNASAQEAINIRNNEIAEWKRVGELNDSADRNRSLRENAYEKNRTDVFDFNKSKLDDDFSKSDRELRFELARSGLFGGSVDTDDRAKQNLAYDKGAIQARSLSDDAASKYRGADEQSRLEVINQIQSGVDSGSAIASAQRGLEIAADKAAASATGNAIGNVFSDAGLLYQDRQRQLGQEQGQKQYASKFGAFFTPKGGESGTTRR